MLMEAPLADDRSFYQLHAEADIGGASPAMAVGAGQAGSWHVPRTLQMDAKARASAVMAAQPSLARTTSREVLEDRFGVGEQVVYWSDTHHTWMEATVLRQNLVGGRLVSYDLDVKKGAAPGKVRPRGEPGLPVPVGRKPEAALPTPLVNDALRAGTGMLGGRVPPAAAEVDPGPSSRTFIAGGLRPPPEEPEWAGYEEPPAPRPASPARSQAAPPRLEVGERVEYWSETYGQWMQATVQRVRDGGFYDLDVKKGANGRKIRQLQADLPSALSRDTLVAACSPEGPEEPRWLGRPRPSQGQASSDTALPPASSPAAQTPVPPTAAPSPATAAATPTPAAENRSPTPARVPPLPISAAGEAAAYTPTPSPAPSPAPSPPAVSPQPSGFGEASWSGQTAPSHAGAGAAAAARPSVLFMGTGVEGRRRDGVSGGPPTATVAPRHRISVAVPGASGERAGAPELRRPATWASPGPVAGPAPGAGPAVSPPPRSVHASFGAPQQGLDGGELRFGQGNFDPADAQVFQQLRQGLGASDRAALQEMQGFRGGLNEGVWFLNDPASREELVLKLVRCHRIAPNVPTEAENLQKLAVDFPGLVSDPAVAFPIKLFSCIGSDGTKRHDLIVMRKVRGERLAEFIAVKQFHQQTGLIMATLEKLGAYLAEFHLRYGNCQHGDFQPSNIFYDEHQDEFYLIDIGGMGVPTMETDVEHFNKAMRIMSDSYGARMAVEGIHRFEQGYASVTGRR